MKLVINVLKRLIMSFLLIYSLNVIISDLNVFVPINFVSIAVISLLGIPGMLSFLVLLIL